MAADHPRGFEAYGEESVPQAAVGSPSKQGGLELGFAPDRDGATRLVWDYARTPFHVTGALDDDPHPDGTRVCVQSTTGGVAQGDRHRIEVDARAGSVAHVTTQSATKVQSMARNYGASDVTLAVGAGAHLDYVPDPVILHADARFHQSITLDLAPDASAVVADVVVPGRLARGERFAFERYVSRLDASGPDGLLFADATDLAGDAGDVGVLGEFDVYGALYVVAPDAEAPAQSDALHDAATRAATAVGGRAGASALPNDAGVAVRALGDRAADVTTALRAAWSEARETLVGAPAPEAV